MMRPGRGREEIKVESFHHKLPSPSVGMTSLDTRNVKPTETTEVIHTSEVSGASKFMSSELLYLALAIASLMKYDTAVETSLIMRMPKIQTSSSILGSVP